VTAVGRVSEPRHLAPIRSGTAAPPKVPWLWSGVTGEGDLKIQEIEASSRSGSWAARGAPKLRRAGGHPAIGGRDSRGQIVARR
jgi:hypothetical protein